MVSSWHADVVVIGAGIIGASVAWHLAKKKVDVLVLEKSDPCSGTSGACDGMVFLQSKKPGVHLALAMAGRNRFDTLEQELDADIALQCSGGIMAITSEAELTAVNWFVQEQNQAGLGVSLLDIRQARELAPCLSPNLPGATFCSLDARVNPIYLTLAFLEAAERCGTRVLSRTPVMGIGLKTDGIFVLDTPQKTIETRTIVNAAGVHAPKIGKMVGLDIPITPRRGQILVTGPMAPVLDQCLISAAYVAAKYDPAIAESGHMGISMEQTEAGNFLLGSTREFVGFDRSTTLTAVKHILAETTAIIPALQDASLMRTFAGLRPYTPDGLPILGRVPSLPGFIMAAGHEGDGIALSPVTGQLIAELITDGTTCINLTPFCLERFSNGAVS